MVEKKETTSRKQPHEKSNSIGSRSIMPINGTTGFMTEFRVIGPNSGTYLLATLVSLPSGFYCGNAQEEGDGSPSPISATECLTLNK